MNTYVATLANSTRTFGLVLPALLSGWLAGMVGIPAVKNLLAGVPVGNGLGEHFVYDFLPMAVLQSLIIYIFWALARRQQRRNHE